MADTFLNIPLNRKTVDIYHIRTAILRAIDLHLLNFKGRLLDAGCGKMPYREYIRERSDIEAYVGLDIEAALTYDAEVQPDVTWDGITMPFEDNSFDTVIATEVLEHCPDPLLYLKEVQRVLKPGGYFFFTVPYLWPLHEVPHDAFRYTPFTLERLFEQSGFTSSSIQASGGFNASLAVMLGLWMKRHLGQGFQANVMRGVLMPFYKWLLKKDKIPKTFTESTMITGLNGTAKN